jgi:hypothetical protein
MDGTVLNRPEQIRCFNHMVVRSAIRIYLATGMKANSSYTPANMRAYVTRQTGKSYPRSRRGLQQAYDDLNQLLGANK